MYNIEHLSRFFATMTKPPPKPWFLKRLRNKFNALFRPEKCVPLREVMPIQSDLTMINQEWRQPRIVIIGAGMAGLSAAHHLLQCGIRNFIILEATERPGGRIHSQWIEDGLVELGAMWIEGANVSNIAFQLAIQEGLVQQPLERCKFVENTIFFTSKGRSIDKETANKALMIFQEFIEVNAVLSDLVGKSKTLGEFFTEYLNMVTGHLPFKQRMDLMHVIGCLYNELQNRIGENPCFVNPRALSEKKYLPGGRIRIPLGFGTILTPLLRNLPACSILYCKPVHFIDWDPKAIVNRARVVCGDKEEFVADYVLVTVSLGVLKQDACTMFVPGLPETKQKAIRRLGFADVERIFIQYDNPFWRANMGIGFGWKLNELNKDNWTRGLGELTSVPGSKAMLHGMIGSYPATLLSGSTPDSLIPDVGKVIRKFTGDTSIPDPRKVIRSDWSSNPYFNGSFSYLGFKSTPDHINALAEPIPNPCDLKDGSDLPLLMFAGEATSRYNFSTVHGARESGIREAQRIVDITNVLRGPPVCRQPCPPCPPPPKPKNCLKTQKTHELQDNC